MDNTILNSYSKISHLNVSRETCNGLRKLYFDDSRQKQGNQLN